MKNAYINFLNHCYIDTEVEMKEIYASQHMWSLFENFLIDMALVSNVSLFRNHWHWDDLLNLRYISAFFEDYLV